MTHRRAMAITSSKMATSHTCHNADEAVVKKKKKKKGGRQKRRRVSLSDPSAFIASPCFSAISYMLLRRLKGGQSLGASVLSSFLDALAR